MSNIFYRDFGRPQTNGFVPNLYGNGGSPVVSTNPNATYARPVPKSQRALYGNGGSGNLILNSTPQSPSGTTMTTSSSNNASSNHHNLYRYIKKAVKLSLT